MGVVQGFLFFHYFKIVFFSEEVLDFLYFFSVLLLSVSYI